MNIGQIRARVNEHGTHDWRSGGIRAQIVPRSKVHPFGLKWTKLTTDRGERVATPKVNRLYIEGELVRENRRTVVIKLADGNVIKRKKGATLSDRKQVIEILKWLVSAGYPGNAIKDDEVLVVYCQILADVPYEALKAAAHAYASEDHEFFPRAGKLRTMALKLVHGLSDEETAEEAWGRARGLMLSVGAAGEYDWDGDPIMRDTVRACGGWKYLCMSEQTISDRARFINAWNVMLKRRRDDALMPDSSRQLLGKSAGMLGE